MLKKIIIVVVSLITLPLVLAAFTANQYHVERKIQIDLPVQDVFYYIKHLKNQNYYSKWAMMDPNMKKSYRGIDGTVGFVSAWDSTNEEVGKGEQEIVSIIDGKRIDFELRFISPFESTEPAYMTTSIIDENHTEVTWGFSGHMDYPMNLMLLFMEFEKIIGDDLATGLTNLKSVLEQP